MAQLPVQADNRANSVSDSVLPSGSLNHAIRSPFGVVQMQLSS